ncbi:MAG: hypothetical protein DCF25_22165 [Leptolyngbya foveolarum]|uniref:Uncharacterized protein n=1 Tax=Leptolyngbya foveolarum TaxID=47253 RepID=A0A2W4TIC2_9CYAN|nr:MAG: hypothetical protein DCF25_22165 [Leptolyngbya foveolarum]
MSLNTRLSSAQSVGLVVFASIYRPFEWQRKRNFALALLPTFLAMGGLGAIAPSAQAQTAGSLTYDRDTGAVRINNNAFDIQTGKLENASDIPLPDGLPTQVQDRVSQPTFSDRLAPNSIEISPDVDYVERSLNGLLSERRPDARYDLQAESLKFTTQFNLSHSQNNHSYGEGIQVTVLDADGNVVNQQTAFVRGDKVREGPNGQNLPESVQLDVSYGPTERVELRVLNIRKDGAEPSESGIYFSQDGEFIVEDLQNGGDRDFNDGDYVQFFGGRGEATTLEERENITYETRVTEVPLDPEIRREEMVETEVMAVLQEPDEAQIEETREWGRLEAPDTVAARLGHASGVRTENDEQLVYSEYTNESQFRLGSDGLGITGQLKPLIGNPNVPPTLLSGNLTFNPTVGNNEAGLTGTLGVTQYLNPTHRIARDAAGNEIVGAGGDRLLEPAGLLTNRRLVGYVPPTPNQQAQGERVFSSLGIFELPGNQAVLIAPPDATKVGRGNAAYTDNVGGLLIEYATGEISFVPQWTVNGYASEAIELAAGEARRIVYALVPQQAGQALMIGQRYAVVEETDGYVIADGNFTIISADRQPQNFVQETTEVYAVEDTLAARNNAATGVFNGIQGVYAEQVGGERISTVDVTVRSEADARVGNELFPLNTVIGSAGQRAYGKTTRAGGFYLGGSLTAGVGNQEDTVSRSSAAVAQAMDAVRTIRTLNTFATPQIRREEVVLEISDIERSSGTAFFDINRNGELTNARFENDSPSSQLVSSMETERTSTVIRGEEALIDSVTIESTALVASETAEPDEEATTRTDSYPNFSAVQGEVALGAVMNLGNTPWTTAANTVRAEVFARDIVVGRGSDGVETGWRVEAAFHPFGERQREAYQYDEAGEVVPIYRTERMLDESGAGMVENLLDESGGEVVVAVNQFVLDEGGDRVAQKVGTGVAKGPGIYISIEDVSDDDEGILVAGGLQFSF